jgi:hypothetical protein
VLNHKIFGSKKFGELRLDFVADGHRFVAYEVIIQKKRVVRPSNGQFGKWFLVVLTHCLLFTEFLSTLSYTTRTL